MAAQDHTLQAEERTPAQIKKLLGEVTVNSTAVYLVAFLVVYAIYYLTNSAVGHYWDIDNTLFYYGTDFSSYRGAWYRSYVISIYGAGPILCLLWALVNIRLYFLTYKKPGIGKLFHAWSIIHGFIMFFGAATVGVFTKSGFGYALRWSYLPYAVCIIIAVVAAVLLLTLGLRFINFFMYAAPSTQLFDENDTKKSFVRSVVLYPYVLGSLFLLIFQVPELPLANVLLILCPGLVCIPMWARSLNIHNTYGISFQRSYKVEKVMVILSVGLLLAFRLGLSAGYRLDNEPVQKGPVKGSIETKEVK